MGKEGPSYPLLFGRAIMCKLLCPPHAFTFCFVPELGLLLPDCGDICNPWRSKECANACPVQAPFYNISAQTPPDPLNGSLLCTVRLQRCSLFFYFSLWLFFGACHSVGRGEFWGMLCTVCFVALPPGGGLCLSLI